MVSSRWLDEPLQTELDDAAMTALRQWCAQTETTFRLVRWLTGGRSTARVAAVLSDDPHEGARQLIMKLDQAPGTAEDPQPGEFARHRRALTESRDFARQHLTKPVHQPIPVGDGRWFVFQRVAGGSLRDPITLHTLLDAVLHPPRPARGAGPDHLRGPQPTFPRPAANAAAFADVSTAVVGSVLGEWAGRTRLPSMDVPAILGRQLGDRLAPGSRLHRLAAAHPGRTITVEEEDHPLPNPFALVLDARRTAGVRLPTFVGRAHGDLHVENILIPTDLRDASAAFQLIDLSRYAADAVLTRDPTHLVLHVLARTLVELSPAQRTATIDVLLDPDLDGALLPQWLWLFIDQVRSAGQEWARAADLVEQWRDQVPLSLLACALTCLGRASTREEDRGWFLRLAANAAAAFLDQQGLDQHELDQQGQAQPAPENGDREQHGLLRADADGAGPPSPDPPVADSANGRPAGGTTGGFRASPRSVDGIAGGARVNGPSVNGPSVNGSAVNGSAVDLLLFHARADAVWADWIGWHLEAAGWRVLPYPDHNPDDHDLDDHDLDDHGSPDGADESVGPQTAISLADAVAQVPRTLVVLSPAYLRELQGSAEWQEAFPAATAARGGRLVTIRVEPCDPPDWLGLVASVDLVGLGEDEARATLVDRMTALRNGDGDTGRRAS
ncbi:MULTISPECIES: toll/interleukin-1 receptor domain-containing protein [Frankia]|uniref:toll/interleukin-1 receptor domain-containing protein n=1 Tax=Frankia TaxID=1854 RepID=UPI001F5BE6EB|nr:MULTISPECIES: toll/interleukin-1 receptor domain-containing protein [Frankia]